MFVGWGLVRVGFGVEFLEGVSRHVIAKMTNALVIFVGFQLTRNLYLDSQELFGSF